MESHNAQDVGECLLAECVSPASIEFVTDAARTVTHFTSKRVTNGKQDPAVTPIATPLIEEVR